MLARLGVRVGGLDLFVPAMLRPRPIALWRELARLAGKAPRGGEPDETMPPALVAGKRDRIPGYRSLGKQLIRIDMAEKLLREAHTQREEAANKPAAEEPKPSIEAPAEAQSEVATSVDSATPSEPVPQSPAEPIGEASATDADTGTNETAPAQAPVSEAPTAESPVGAATPPAPTEKPAKGKTKGQGKGRNADRGRGRKGPRPSFPLDPARAISMGLTPASY